MKRRALLGGGVGGEFPTLQKVFARNCLILNSANLFQERKSMIEWPLAILANRHPMAGTRQVWFTKVPLVCQHQRRRGHASSLEAANHNAGVKRVAMASFLLGVLLQRLQCAWRDLAFRLHDKPTDVFAIGLAGE